MDEVACFGGFMVWGFGFRGFFGLRVWGFRVLEVGCRLHGFRVQSCRFGV